MITENMKGWHAEMSPNESKDLAYWERNMLALLLALTHGEYIIKGTSGWYLHGEYEGWSRVISIGDGKITFHVPDDFDIGDLQKIEPNWDGHSTYEKWSYIMQLCGIKNDNK